MNLKNISEQHLGESVVRLKPIHNGHITDAYSVSTREKHFFLKVIKTADFPDFFDKEKDGLLALKESFENRVPEVFAVVAHEGLQLIFMEFIESGDLPDNFWSKFGRKLAQMHKHTHAEFGWKSDNYVGSIPQTNCWKKKWDVFFIENRLLPLIKKAVDLNFFTSNEVTIAEALFTKIGNMFPAEKPSFIHGDLWCGNFLIDKKGVPVLIDPSVSFSHREMDIGLSKLFGGFPTIFYDAYHEIFPLENGWRERLPLTQLYPLLVHALTYGGSYVTRSKETLAYYK